MQTRSIKGSKIAVALLSLLALMFSGFLTAPAAQADGGEGESLPNQEILLDQLGVNGIEDPIELVPGTHGNRIPEGVHLCFKNELGYEFKLDPEGNQGGTFEGVGHWQITDHGTFLFTPDPNRENPVFSAPSVDYFACGEGSENLNPGTITVNFSRNDYDHVFGEADMCPGTPKDVEVDWSGCSIFSLPNQNKTVNQGEEFDITPGKDGDKIPDIADPKTVAFEELEGSELSPDGKTLTVPGEGTWTVGVGLFHFVPENDNPPTKLTPIKYTANGKDGSENVKAGTVTVKISVPEEPSVPDDNQTTPPKDKTPKKQVVEKKVVRSNPLPPTGADGAVMWLAGLATLLAGGALVVARRRTWK